MKTCRKFLAIAVCLVLLVSFAVPAFAALGDMEVLLRETADGYNCVGQGVISREGTTYIAHGSFSATRAGGILETINPEMCSSKVIMQVYDADGLPWVTTHSPERNLEAVAQYESAVAISKVAYYYKFNANQWGPFEIEV